MSRCFNVFLFWSLLMVYIFFFFPEMNTVMCLPAPCYYLRVEDGALLCATSGRLRGANERREGGESPREMKSTCAVQQDDGDGLQAGTGPTQTAIRHVKPCLPVQLKLQCLKLTAYRTAANSPCLGKFKVKC